MSITLTPEQETEIAARVASGKYPSGAAVLDDALALLRAREEYEAKRSALIADIAAGDADIAAGLGVQITATQILAELRAKMS